jgi:UPF0755 protein
MRFIKILSAILLVSALTLGGILYWIFSSLDTPNTHDKAEQFIEIPKGSSPNQIMDKLESEGILKTTLPVQIYLRTFGDASNLQAGEYQFPSPITPFQVLEELRKGTKRSKNLTIPEGFTRFDIAERVAANFPANPPMDKDAVLKLMDDTSLIKDIAPTAKNLEGYMYPSTYDFSLEATPQDVIKRTVEQFRKIWKPEWSLRARELGRTPNEIVIIASLIETESKFEKERPIVASVIYNRINKNIPLGIDQTAVYIAKMENRWDGTINKSDLDSNSPYNTRKFGGIPPGPISSVSESAIKAALYPDKTDYIFYVLNVENNDGSHNFYASASEFEKGKAAYQKWLQEQRSKQ